MINTKTDNFTDIPRKSIDFAIKDAINNEFDKAIKQAIVDANSRRDEVIASTSLKLTQYFSIQDNGNNLTITITIEKPK